MSGELLVLVLVSLLVFGPRKLPMLALHLGKLLGFAYSFKQKLAKLWEALLNEQQLIDNKRKAEKADAKYQDDAP